MPDDFIAQQLKDVTPWFEDEGVALKIRSHAGQTKWLNITHEQYERIATILTEGE